MVMQLGIGTDIRGEDYTKAAVRGALNAIRQNTLTVADAFGKPREEMVIKVHVGAAKPDEIDIQKVADVFPYGKVSVLPEQGGMDLDKDSGGQTILVNVAVIVYLDLPNDVKAGEAA